MVNLMLGFEVVTFKTPTLPDTKCGATSPTQVTETSAQLKDGLVWDKCSFCGSYVLIDAYKQRHEKCTCGATKITRKGGMICGWRKDGKEWIMC
jgi:hypothetical protein